MSMCVLGMSAELAEQGIAANALWPRTVIWTAAGRKICSRRTPVRALPQAGNHADAAYAIPDQ